MVKKLLALLFAFTVGAAPAAPYHQPEPPQSVELSLAQSEQADADAYHAEVNRIVDQLDTDLKAVRKERATVIEWVKAETPVNAKGRPPIPAMVDFVYETSGQKGLDPLMVLSVMRVESSYQSHVESHGSRGLMQVFERVHRPTVQRYTRQYKASVYDYRVNIQTGTDILQAATEASNGSPRAALSRYNGSIKDKTYAYAKKVLAVYNVMKQAIACAQDASTCSPPAAHAPPRRTHRVVHRRHYKVNR